MTELTIQEACKYPQNFMYIWADEQSFLQYLKPQWASVIRGKKANQNKLLLLSAQKYGKSVGEYTSAIREAFYNTWGVYPGEALVILAQGGSIAGKNWKEGVFGIGAFSNTFPGTKITVRPNDGYFEKDGKLLPGDEDLNVYIEMDGKAVVFQRFYEDSETGAIYMSQLNKTTKKYYAATYTTPSGSFNATDSTEIKTTDSADIWGAIVQSIGVFINWLISLFTNKTEKDKISADNTLPNQINDGFVQPDGGAGMLESSGLLLALAAAGILLAGGVGTPNQKKSK